MKLKVLLVVVALIQIILGLAYLFFPQGFLHWMGHSSTAVDINYPLGMLASRFFAYGFGMLVISRDPVRHIFWINNMVMIQLFDLSVGIFYTMSGVVTLQLSALPIFNAALIAALLWLWRPRSEARLAIPS